MQSLTQQTAMHSAFSRLSSSFTLFRTSIDFFSSLMHVGSAFAPYVHQWALAAHEPVTGSPLFLWTTRWWPQNCSVPRFKRGIQLLWIKRTPFWINTWIGFFSLRYKKNKVLRLTMWILLQSFYFVTLLTGYFYCLYDTYVQFLHNFLCKNNTLFIICLICPKWLVSHTLIIFFS